MHIDWMIVLVSAPALPIENGGVLVLDHEAKRLTAKLMQGRPEWDEDVVAVWNAFGEELNELSNELDADQLMSWLESSASNAIRVSERQSMETDNIVDCLDRLYAAHVQSNSRVARSSV